MQLDLYLHVQFVERDVVEVRSRAQLLTGKSFVSRDEGKQAGLEMDWIDESLLNGTFKANSAASKPYKPFTRRSLLHNNVPVPAKGGRSRLLL